MVNSTTITATTPAHAAGAVSVTVTNPDAQSGTLSSGFTYATPTEISFVQVAEATPQVPSGTVSVPYAGPQTPGDLNVIAVGWNDTTATVQSVQDSAGNTYNRAMGPTSGIGLRQSIYYAKNIVGGTNTVTVSFSQPANWPDIRILEYRGVSALDVTAGASGSGTTSNSGSVPTTAAEELIFGAGMVSTDTRAPGTGFTARAITQIDSDIAEDRIVTTAGTYSATSLMGTSGNWVMQMATFKTASAFAPAVTGVTPGSGPTDGGTAVTITGTDFAPGATVSVGGSAADGVSVVNSTTITATTPPHAAGAVAVTVTNADGQSGTLANGFTYTSTSPASPVISLVQHTGKDAGTTTSSTLAFPANNTAHNWITVVVRAGRTGQRFTITDTGGNTYRQAVQLNETADGTTLAIFYAENIAAGANIVTVSDTIAGGTLRFALFEYSGVATTNSLDVTASAQGTGTTPNSGSVTTTASGDLVIGGISTAESSTFTAGSGFVIQERVPAASTKLIVEDRRQTTAGAVSASATLSATGIWAAVMATFKRAQF